MKQSKQGCKIGCDHLNNTLLVRYSSHDLDNQTASNHLNIELVRY